MFKNVHPHCNLHFFQYIEVKYNNVQCRKVQGNAVQYWGQVSMEKYSAVQKSTLHYRKVLRSTEKYSALQRSTPQYRKVPRSTEKYFAVQRSTQQYRKVLCSTEKYSAVQNSTPQYRKVLALQKSEETSVFPDIQTKKAFFKSFLKSNFQYPWKF